MEEMDDLEKLELEDAYAIARKKHFGHMRESGACFRKGVFMQIYIVDFVEDLNYRKVILSIGGVDSEKLYSRLKQDCVNHLNRFRGCLENKLMFIENCDLQDVDTDHGDEFGNSLLYLIADEGFSVCPLHYDIDSDRYFIKTDIG